MLSKVPGGYLDVRTKGRAPGFGGHGEIVAGTQASRQKALANSRLAVPALHMLTCSAQACQTPTSLPSDTRGKFYLYTDRFCVVTVVLGSIWQDGATPVGEQLEVGGPPHSL